MTLAGEAGQSASEGIFEMIEVAAKEVAQLDPLQVPPDALTVPNLMHLE